MHDQEKVEEVEFGIRVIQYCRTSFERQILESVQIQENRMHYILNSKSEYNRCALPRLQSKVGETEFKTWADEKREDKEKEKELENKIRDLRMIRNRARKPTNKENEMPAEKKRKLTSNSFTNVRQSQTMPVKRKTSDNVTGESKRRKITDWLLEKNENDEEASTPPTSQDTQDGEPVEPVEAGEESVQDPKVNEAPPPLGEKEKSEMEEARSENEEGGVHDRVERDETPVTYGAWEKVEMMEFDYKKHIKDYEREKAKEEKERNERIEITRGLESGWKLFRLSKEFIDQNSPHWTKLKELRELEKLKADRLEIAKQKKKDSIERYLEKKIEANMKKLPEQTRIRLRNEDDKIRLMELKEAKQNMWKKWRTKNTPNPRKLQEPRKEALELNLKLIEKELKKLEEEKTLEREKYERESKRREDYIREKRLKENERIIRIKMKR